jgi:hypothetical protein
MEEQVYTVLEARKYSGIYEKFIYEALKSGDLQGKKDGKQGNKWLISKASLDAYKGRIERGEVEIGFSLAVKQEQVSPVKVPQEEVLSLPAKTEKPVEKQNDGKLLQDILSSTFSFLAEHQFAITFQSIEEVDVALRLWIVKTPDTTLNIVASGAQVTVLSEAYQKQLEEKSAALSQQLRKSETTLAILREKKREVILKEYAHDLSVWIEPRPDGFLVWCERFPFSAIEKTEEDALAAFRRVLWGYTCWLRNHQEKLTVEMKTQFEALKGLLVEE